MISLLPIQYFSFAVYAADSIQPIVISNPIGTKENPSQLTSDRVTVTGNFFAVSNLSISIAQYRKTSDNKYTLVTSRSAVEGARVVDNTFTFYDVQLYEGLNEITVSGVQNGQRVAATSWVEVNSLPVITSVKYYDQDLLTNNKITTTLLRDELILQGTVYNATSIVAKVNGKATEYDGSIRNDNTYVITRIPLQRGKNTIELIARNITKTYPMVIEVEYNDNQPFVEGKLGSLPLVDPMNFADDEITITGTFHNFSNNDELRITFNGNPILINGVPKSSITGEEFTSADFPTDTNDGISVTQLANQGYGKFKLRFTEDYINLNGTNYLIVTFVRGGVQYTQTFTLEHLNKQYFYVSNISGLSDTSISRIVTFRVTLANDYDSTATPSKLTVTQIYADSTGTPQSKTLTGKAVDGLQWTYEYTAELVAGMNTIRVQPNGDDVNQRDYRVLYINSPDVKILNLVNGDRIGVNGLKAELHGELINVSEADRLNTTIIIENSMGRVSEKLDEDHFDPTNTFRFTYDLEKKLTAGANDITIQVRSGSTQTSTRITVFYFTTESPTSVVELNSEANSLDPFVSSYRFKEVASKQYETESRFVYVNFSAYFVENALIYFNGQRIATVEKESDNWVIRPVAGWEQYFPSNFTTNDKDSFAFSIYYPFELIEGQNTIEIEAINSQGVSRSDKLFINRLQLPVKLINPDLEIEKVVNSNYIEIVIEAAADAVRIGKTEAVKEKLDPATLLDLIEKLPTSKRNEIYKDYDLNNDKFLSEEELEKIDQSLVANPRFKADYFLKAGKNKITYEVEVNGKKSKYEFEIYYAASSTEGAKYKTAFKTGKLEAFDKKVSMNIPKNTWLVNREYLNQYGSSVQPIFDEFVSDAYITFGIVDQRSGKLDKKWNELTKQFELVDFEDVWKLLMPYQFLPPDRTGYAGQIYWIEADGYWPLVDSGYVPTNRIELTLAYDPSIRDDAQNLLAIYHFDPEKEQWVNMGGVVDTKKKTVTVQISEFGYYTVMAKRGTFNDIFNHSWAANFLTTMFAKGIMLPETSNRFGSDMLTSRGEFATMLVKVLELPIDAGPYLNGDKRYPVNPTFVDVNPLLDPPNGFYSYEYIETAGRAGIIRGMGQGEFGPDGLLTREQAAMMIARAANYKLTSDISKAKANLSKTYVDVNSMSDYAAPYVEAVLKAGVMTGTSVNGSKMMSFNPNQYLTRAEVAAIAYRLMQNLKKLPK